MQTCGVITFWEEPAIMDFKQFSPNLRPNKFDHNFLIWILKKNSPVYKSQFLTC